MAAAASAQLSGQFYEVRAAHFLRHRRRSGHHRCACIALNVDVGTISFPFSMAVTVPQQFSSGVR